MQFRAGLLLRYSSCYVMALSLSGCVLAGIEPEEIDVADESEGGIDTGLTTAGEGQDAETSGNGTDDGDPGGDGDGDGDPAGDGDGDDTSCLGFGSEDLYPGDTAVAIPDQSSALAPSCGGLGPEQVYRFVAPSAGDWQFEVEQADFTATLALASGCVPLDELACATDPAVLQTALVEGQVVFVIVDSEPGGGTATLTVSVL